MRVVGGKLRGRRLAAPKNQSIRPTTDRNRESLFNILSHRWPQQLEGRVLDVFAGTGALGCEALSRGGTHCTFMENSPLGLALIRQNIADFELSDCTTALRCDVVRPVPVAGAMPVNLVFADPPYGKGLGERAATALAENGWLDAHAILVLEEAKGHLPKTLGGFELLDQRQLGTTSIGIFGYIGH